MKLTADPERDLEDPGRVGCDLALVGSLVPVADEEHLQPPVVGVSEVEAESGVVAVSELADRQQVDRVRLALDPGNLQFNYTREPLSQLCYQDNGNAHS